MSGNENTQLKVEYRYFQGKKIYKVTQEREFEAVNHFNMHIINCQTLYCKI